MSLIGRSKRFFEWLADAIRKPLEILQGLVGVKNEGRSLFIFYK
jgi:hypothetical protein